MEGNEISLRDQGVQVSQGHAPLVCIFCGDVGVIGNHVHAKSLGAAHHLLGDPTQANGAQRLVAHFDAHELVPLPLPAMDMGIGLGNAAGQGHEHRDGVFGGGHHVAGGRVDDDDARLRGGFDIDIVHADAGAPDHPELLARLDHGCGHLGGAAHEQGIVGWNDFQ